MYLYYNHLYINHNIASAFWPFYPYLNSLSLSLFSLFLFLSFTLHAINFHIGLMYLCENLNTLVDLVCKFINNQITLSIKQKVIHIVTIKFVLQSSSLSSSFFIPLPSSSSSSSSSSSHNQFFTYQGNLYFTTLITFPLPFTTTTIIIIIICESIYSVIHEVPC